MKWFHRKKPALHFEDAARFNWALDTDEELQAGIFRLTERFPALTEAEYADEMLALFRRAGLDLSCKDLHMLLALRQESDRMLLRQKRPSNDAQARPHTQR